MSEHNGPVTDLAARWALVEPHRERLLAIARARCAAVADAEDCVHEAMLRVVEFAALDPARVGQLLTSVTIRLAADTHRERARSRRAGLAVAVGEIADPGPESGVCDRAEAAWLATLARALPERQRAVLAVRASGADGSETAARLHLSYKAVESAMSRARASLRIAVTGTLGVAAALYRRWHAGAAPAAGALAMVAVTSIAVVSGVRPPAGQPAPPAGAAPAAAPAVRERASVTSLRPARAVRVPAAPPVRRPVPEAPRPAARTSEFVQNAGTDDAGVRLEIERHDEDETLLQTVERCLREGVAVSRDLVGCRPRGS